jgi:hypothetical protein
MDRFQERIESNPVHAELRSLNDFIARLSDDAAAQIDEIVPGLRQRVSAVVAYAQGVLATADPYLVPTSTLVNLQNTAAQANATASALATTPANAPTLDQQLDELLIPATALGALNPVTAKTAKAVGEVLGSSAAARAADLEAQARLFESQLRDLESQHDQQVTALSNSIEEKRVEFQGAADTIAQTFGAQQAEVATQLTAFAQQFSVAEANRNGQFGETVTAIRATSDNLTTDLEKQHAGLITAQTEAGDAALAGVEAVNAKVNELFQAVAQTGTAGAYAEDAVEQRDIANKWRLGAVGSALFAVVVALAAMLHYWNATQTSAADVTSKAPVGAAPISRGEIEATSTTTRLVRAVREAARSGGSERGATRVCRSTVRWGGRPLSARHGRHRRTRLWWCRPRGSEGAFGARRGHRSEKIGQAPGLPRGRVGAMPA